MKPVSKKTNKRSAFLVRALFQSVPWLTTALALREQRSFLLPLRANIERYNRAVARCWEKLSFFISGAGTMCHCSGKTQIINPWPLGATDGVLRCDGEAVPALLHLPVPSRHHLATERPPPTLHPPPVPWLMKLSRLHRPFRWQLLTALG